MKDTQGRPVPSRRRHGAVAVPRDRGRVRHAADRCWCGVLVLDGGEPYVGLVVASLGRSGSGHSRARAAARQAGNSSTSAGPRDDAAPLLRLSDAWARPPDAAVRLGDW